MYSKERVWGINMIGVVTGVTSLEPRVLEQVHDILVLGS